MFYVADHDGHADAPKVGHVYVSVGSLTSEIDKLPVAHVSYEESVSWIAGSHDLPKFRGKTDQRMPR